jgi:predicted amidohydrolase YtcJ
MAQGVPGSGADTVLSNGNVITVDADFRRAQAIAIAGDRFVLVGSNDEIEAVVGPDTKRIDLQGRSVLPGFIDLHGHIGLFGLEKHFLELDGAGSVEEICARIAERAAATPAGLPILTTPVGDHPYFFGVPDVLAEARFPNRWDLDGAAPDHPVYITAPTNRVPNSAVFNSRALEIAGITRHTLPNGPPNRVRITPEAYWLDGIEVRRDPATGEPTGELRSMQPIYNPSSFFETITNFVPPPTYEVVREGIRQMAPDFLSWGTTTLLENHLTVPEEFRAYAELDLPLRVFYSFELDPSRSAAETEDFLRTIGFASGAGFGTDRVATVGVSLGLDGPHWHGTAYTGEPYMGPYGALVNPEPLVPAEHYKQLLRLAAKHGFRIHTEAAGRGSIALALETLAEIDREFSLAHRRTILEHCEFPTREQIGECARLGIIPTTTTNFLWGKGDEVFLDRLGPEYAENAIPNRWWLDAGVPVCNETDWGPHEPMFTMWQSIARTTGLTGKAVGAHQSVTREEAIRMMTSNCAYALFKEDALGSIEPGKLADLVVLSDDPLTCAEDAMKDIQVLATFVGGQVVHQSEPLAIGTTS